MIRKYEVLKSAACIVLVFLGTKLMAQDPPDISLIFYLDENSENSTLVGTVTATDPDGDLLTYSITSGNSAGGFSINSSSGDITVSDENVLDFETTPTFSLMVEADDGNGGMTTASITINLIDLDERVLGIGDGDDGFAVYPNPVQDVFSIDLNSIQVKKAKIEIYSTGGSLIPVKLKFLSDTRVEIDASLLNGGIYFLKIGNRENTEVIRIVKQN